jgi:hypothetical protein
MRPARALANQKLYHAVLHQRMLARELAREDVAAGVLLEAVGRSVQHHLRDAYGWFLLELAAVEDLPTVPPHSVAQLVAGHDIERPLRGELVELMNLERRSGWLVDLLSDRSLSVAAARSAPAGLSLVQSDWSQAELQAWYEALEALIERMSDSLDEW